MAGTRSRLALCLAAVLSMLPAASAFAQGFRYDNTLTGVNGIPRAGATVAVCQSTGLATTGASVSGNVATLTMSSNPVSLGFVVGGNITVSGFTGADTYFNGSFVLTNVSTTALSFNLTHANASATSNGAVTQTVSAAATCAPWATIFTDAALTIPTLNPMKSDGLGNYGFAAAPGQYPISFNGAGVIPTTNTLTLPCVPNSTCPGVGGTVTSFSAGNLSPPFTSSVATPTTTPALSFALNSQSANLFFASPNGSSGTPSYRAMAGADIPATTSNCSGVQFAQGLNAGHTPVCATPPTFGASGASHSVGYVPDPGAVSGTTHFLREDATWQTVPPSGVSESFWTPAGEQTAVGVLAKTIFPNAHTLVRATLSYTAAPSGCTTNGVVKFRDATSSTDLVTFTNVNGTAFYDSGVLSTALTAGHTFTWEVTTAASGCTGFASGFGKTVILQ